MTKGSFSRPSPSCAIRHLGNPWGQFGVSLSTPPSPARDDHFAVTHTMVVRHRSRTLKALRPNRYGISRSAFPRTSAPPRMALSPLPIRPLRRHVLGREGVVSSLLFGRVRKADVSHGSGGASLGTYRGPAQRFQARRCEPLHPLNRLGLRGRPVSPYRTDPPRNPPLPFLARHGREYAALVGGLGVEAVGYPGPEDHGWRVARSGGGQSPPLVQFY